MSHENEPFITRDHVVGIRYILRDGEGREIDSSEDTGPLEYLHGYGQVITALESALEGHREGDRVEVTVTADEGYGPHDPEEMVEVPRDRFDFQPEVGGTVEAQRPDGRSRTLFVREVTDDCVTLDGNHPLAGKTLVFEVTVDSVREASQREIEYWQAQTAR